MEFHRLTVIIGPQASGKSVLCKLGYFFQSLLNDQLRYSSELHPLKAFKEATRDKFLRWFPLESWGDKKFELCFIAGDFEVRITRTEYKGKLGQTFRIHFSEPFQKLYALSLEQADKLAGARVHQLNPVISTWEVREAVQKVQAKLLGVDQIDGQLFVPAGRSFFTSIGKGIAVFEQSSSMDPLTIIFGRIFRSYLDTFSRRRQSGRASPATQAFMEMLGGELKGARDEEHLSMEDGRKIPLSLLSSGQQELLPLVMVLPDRVSYRLKQLLYIEEPEAHLFPSAQSKLVELLASLTTDSREQTSLVITTHSPYVLAKLNNLVLAGSMARTKAKELVGTIIPSQSWLGKGRLCAYAIRDGKLVSITQPDGLINADYLDDVSGAIGKEFDRLLELETSLHARTK